MLVFISSHQLASHNEALHFARQHLSEINSVFFYGAAPYFLAQNPELIAAWQKIAEKHTYSLGLCEANLARYQLDITWPSAFQVVGLTEFFVQFRQQKKLVQF